MILLPAIDIKDGQCVRLYQGDYNQVTTYDADPVHVAQRWHTAGARWLHIVDLDGAAGGEPVNTAVITRIRAAVPLYMELGGGMRTLAHIEQALALGIERIVLGTVALTERALLTEALRRWGERIVVGLDARDGRIAVSGWRETSQVQATTLACELAMAGVRRFIATDIARDGALRGPNISALAALQQALAEVSPPCSIIASGGVSSLEDLRALASLGIEGAIVGKAIYTGDVDLAVALREIEKEGDAC
ncbi:MAG: 1-(5-phosphoribosyl)-5-[(5-phosphoribosylamino)methylideneamino]imidazole-4-carboxamide isomerase [Ktedonobacteraceae bacterium]|nr:1-(5-phosphoribosyl)-5-[(5-phosphoribosylamino)methylideneamino]imidazole-4-carboxamide isomerase [Ktedonobacteraceae bacterium]